MSEKEIVNLSRLQLALLLSAADSVGAGGILVYSTCTIEPEENELVVSRFLELRGDYRLEDAGGFVAGSLVDEEGYYRTLPHKQGLDGAFAARLVKAGK